MFNLWLNWSRLRNASAFWPALPLEAPKPRPIDRPHVAEVSVSLSLRTIEEPIREAYPVLTHFIFDRHKMVRIDKALTSRLEEAFPSHTYLYSRRYDSPET